jgi:hypothetical protein
VRNERLHRCESGSVRWPVFAAIGVIALETQILRAYHQVCHGLFKPPENSMKTFFLSVMAAALLCGCPDTKVPKKPPAIPEPKAVETPARQSVAPTLASSGAAWPT